MRLLPSSIAPTHHEGPCAIHLTGIGDPRIKHYSIENAAKGSSKKPWLEYGLLMDVSVTEIMAKCVGIIAKAQTERCHMVIHRHGQPTAELVSVERGAENKQLFGRAARTTQLLGDLFSTGKGWNAED